MDPEEPVDPVELVDPVESVVRNTNSLAVMVCACHHLLNVTECTIATTDPTKPIVSHPI